MFNALKVCRTWSVTLGRAAATAALLGLAVAAPAQSLPAEVQVGTADVIDFEFDWGRDGVFCPTCNGGTGNARFAYIDKENKLWVAWVDFYSGAFYPSDGKGMLVDVDATSPAEIGNGPEWAFSQRGSEIVYTRWAAGPDRQTMNLGFAHIANGGWTAGLVGNSQGRVLPMASMNPTDPVPTVHYQNLALTGMATTLYWRPVTPGSLDTRLPILSYDPGMTRRSVPGTTDIVVTALLPNQPNKQVYLYHTASNTMEQLTFDPVDKLWGWMWPAPEYNNELLFFAVVDATKLKIYRKLIGPNGNSAWTVIRTITMPQANPYINSPETFVHNGRSYIFFTLSSNSDLHDYSALSLLAITGLDAASPLRYLTTADNPARARRDPEYFITANGPYIYYNRYVPATDSRKLITEGVFAVDTGLGAPVR